MNHSHETSLPARLRSIMYLLGIYKENIEFFATYFEMRYPIRTYLVSIASDRYPQLSFKIILIVGRFIR